MVPSATSSAPPWAALRMKARSGAVTLVGAVPAAGAGSTAWARGPADGMARVRATTAPAARLRRRFTGPAPPWRWEPLNGALLVRFRGRDDPPGAGRSARTAYPFEPAMLSSPGAGPEGWRHDGFSQVATGVRAPVPGRGGLRRVAAGAPLGIGLR